MIVIGDLRTLPKVASRLFFSADVVAFVKTRYCCWRRANYKNALGEAGNADWEQR